MLPQSRIPSTAFVFAFLASCQHVVTPGPSETLIQWSPTMRTMALVGPIGCVLLGLVFWQAQRLRVFAFAAVVTGLVGFPIGVDLRAEQITITDREIFESHGFPWSRSTRGFAFESLQRCKIEPEPQENSASRGDEHRWSLTYADSAQNRAIYPSSLWVRATAEILNELEQRNIECQRLGHSR